MCKRGIAVCKKGIAVCTKFFFAYKINVFRGSKILMLLMPFKAIKRGGLFGCGPKAALYTTYNTHTHLQAERKDSMKDPPQTIRNGQPLERLTADYNGQYVVDRHYNTNRLQAERATNAIHRY